MSQSIRARVVPDLEVGREGARRIPSRRLADPRLAPRLGALVVALASVAIALSPALAQQRAPKEPESPQEVLARRRAGSIEDRVQINLQTAGGELAEAEIAVSADPDGHVILSGRVPSPEAKARAEQLASYSVGVTTVDNRLDVVAPPTPPIAAVSAPPPVTGPPPSDEELAESVARAIATDLPVEARARHRWLRGWQVSGDGWAFEVDAADGVVRLDGRISRDVDVEDVLGPARSVPAVRSVETSLESADAGRKGFFRRLF